MMSSGLVAPTPCLWKRSAAVRMIFAFVSPPLGDLGCMIVLYLQAQQQAAQGHNHKRNAAVAAVLDLCIGTIYCGIAFARPREGIVPHGLEDAPPPQRNVTDRLKKGKCLC